MRVLIVNTQGERLDAIAITPTDAGWFLLHDLYARATGAEVPDEVREAFEDDRRAARTD